MPLGQQTIRPCSQAQFYLHKNIKTYLPTQKRYLWGKVWLAWHCLGVETSLDTEKKHSFFPATQFYYPLHVGYLVGWCIRCCVVIMLLSLFVFFDFVPALPMPELPLVGLEEDACSTNADSSPTTLTHAVCRALKAHALLDRPLPARCVGG